MTAPDVVAVILAGGMGERLGGAIKANIEIGGMPLLARVTAALGDGVAALLVAHGPHPRAALALTQRHIPIPDRPADYGGPLAGLAAAVAWCTQQPRPPRYLLSVAVDTPFFPNDFLARARAAIEPGLPGVLARCGGQDYPTDALWRLAGIAALPDEVLAGTAPRSLRRYAAAGGAVALDWPAGPDGDPFASLNTPQDRLALEARAAVAPPDAGGDKR